MIKRSLVILVLFLLCHLSSGMGNVGVVTIPGKELRVSSSFDLKIKNYEILVIDCVEKINKDKSIRDLRPLERLVVSQWKIMGFRSDFLNSNVYDEDNYSGQKLWVDGMQIITLFQPVTTNYVSSLLALLRDIAAADSKVDLTPLEQLEFRQCLIANGSQYRAARSEEVPQYPVRDLRISDAEHNY